MGIKCESRFAGGTEDFASEREETTLVIGRSDAEYSLTLAAIGEFMAHIAYGFQVEVVSLAAGEVPAALESGRVDIVLNARQPGNEAWFDQAVAAGTILSTGPTYFSDGFPVSGAVTPRIGETGADFLDALKKMEIPLRWLEETDTWWHENDIDGEFRAAVFYFWNYDYQESWKQWMPWNPAERIRQTIERFAKVRYPDLYEGIEYDERFDPIPGGGPRPE